MMLRIFIFEYAIDFVTACADSTYYVVYLLQTFDDLL